MKLQLLIFAALAVICVQADTHELAVRSASCEVVLSSKVCKVLDVVAANLKLLPGDIEKGIKEAIAAGEKSAPEIYNKVVEFLKTQVLNKECEYFLAPQLCVRIRRALEPMNLAKTVGKLVIEAITKGVPGEYEIFLRVLNLIRKEVVGKRCDELLSVQMCQKLKSIAIKLTLKAAQAAKYAIEAIISGYNRRDEIYKAVIDFYREEVAPLTCQDILSHQVCSALQNFGKIFKLTPKEIADAVKDAILRGKLAIKEIINDVKDFIKKMSEKKTCEDLLPDKFCHSVKSLAAKMKIKMHVVDEAIKEALQNGKMEFNELIGFCKDFFKKRVTCESWLGEKICKGLRTFAHRLGVKSREVEDKIRDLISKGKTSVSDIYKQVVIFIKTKIFG